jgi:mannose-1-phosphate guanylyltransferase
MQALILAGGKGTRLRPITLHVPKPVVPIVNRPFIRYQLDLLRPINPNSGLSVILSLSYQPRKIEEALNDETPAGVEITTAVEATPLGTAGAIKNVADRIRGTLIVFNGDVLTDLDLRSVVARHRRRGAAATLVLIEVADTRAYGVVECDDQGRIRGFFEKPAPGVTACRTVNAGIYILEPEVLSLIPAGTPFSFEYDLFPRLLESGLPLYGETTASYWLDIGTPARYLRANLDVLGGRVQRFPPDARPDLTADGALIAPSATVKAGAEIVRSVVGPNCVIDEGCRITDSVILSGARIREGARLDRSVIGRGAHIGDRVTLTEAIIGDKSTLTDFSTNLI